MNIKTFTAAAALSTMAAIGSAEAASKIQFGDCSHPEPRLGVTLNHPSGGSVHVIGRESDIVEFRFNGECKRDYIRDGRNLNGSDIRLGTTPDGVPTVLVRMGRERDLVRVYAFTKGKADGAFDRIQDGSYLGTRTQSDGTFLVTYGRKKDLSGTYTFSLQNVTWTFDKASRGRYWKIQY